MDITAGRIVLFSMFVIFLFPSRVFGAEQSVREQNEEQEYNLSEEVQEEITEQDIADTTEELLNDLELENIESAVSQLLEDDSFSFQEMVEAL